MRVLSGILIFLFCVGIGASEIKEFPYSYGANFKGLILVPNKSGKLPVIIYNYHEDLDRITQFRVYQNAHDMVAFMQVFASWGAICIVPKDRYHELNAIRGAIRYARRMPNADLSQIHVVGQSEGAFMSLLALQQGDGVKSLTMISPKVIHNTGALSYPGMMHMLSRVRVPILLLAANQSSDQVLRMSRLMNTILEQRHKQVTYVEYPEHDQWFWKPQTDFMEKIYQTILYKDPFGDVPKSATSKAWNS